MAAVGMRRGSSMRTRSLSAWVGVVAMAALSTILAAPAGGTDLATYEVTITDLTGGQPLTPPVIATHNGGIHIFQVGRPASFEVKEIAENGNLAPLASALGADGRVFDVEAGGFPLVPPGLPGSGSLPDSVTLTIAGTSSAKYISLESMLICTNDGFTGLDRVRLPNGVGDSVTLLTNAYDAGTEVNTEEFADIVPPCQALVGVSSGEAGTGVSNPALAEGGVIHHHEGILGIADLVPAIHGWTDPVAEVVIERVS